MNSEATDHSDLSYDCGHDGLGLGLGVSSMEGALSTHNSRDNSFHNNNNSSSSIIHHLNHLNADDDDDLKSYVMGMSIGNATTSHQIHPHLTYLYISPVPSHPN